MKHLNLFIYIHFSFSLFLQLTNSFNSIQCIQSMVNCIFKRLLFITQEDVAMVSVSAYKCYTMMWEIHKLYKSWMEFIYLVRQIQYLSSSSRNSRHSSLTDLLYWKPELLNKNRNHWIYLFYILSIPFIQPFTIIMYLTVFQVLFQYLFGFFFQLLLKNLINLILCAYHHQHTQSSSLSLTNNVVGCIEVVFLLLLFLLHSSNKTYIHLKCVLIARCGADGWWCWGLTLKWLLFSLIYTPNPLRSLFITVSLLYLLYYIHYTATQHHILIWE